MSGGLPLAATTDNAAYLFTGRALTRFTSKRHFAARPGGWSDFYRSPGTYPYSDSELLSESLLLPSLELELCP